MSFEDLMVKVDEKVEESDLTNHVVMIVDESGSMARLRNEIPGMFNDQLKDLKETSGKMKTTISLITFSTGYREPIYWKKDIESVDDMKAEQYNPNGGTALYDTIAFVINRLNSEVGYSDPNTSFLVVILTDGEENASQEYRDVRKLHALMDKMKETNRWTFTFIGSSFDVQEAAQRVDINAKNALYFSQHDVGIGYVGAAGAAGVSGRSGASGQSVMGYTADGMTVTNSLDDAKAIHSSNVKLYMNKRKDIKYTEEGKSEVYTASNSFYND